MRVVALYQLDKEASYPQEKEVRKRNLYVEWNMKSSAAIQCERPQILQFERADIWSYEMTHFGLTV